VVPELIPALRIDALAVRSNNGHSNAKECVGSYRTTNSRERCSLKSVHDEYCRSRPIESRREIENLYIRSSRRARCHAIPILVRSLGSTKTEYI
jgi:hypothetical protein